MGASNGLLDRCSMSAESMMKINEIHSDSKATFQYVKHLEKLDVLEKIDSKLFAFLEKGMDMANNKDAIPKDVAWFIFKVQGIGNLLFILTIVFLITGAKLGWLDLVGQVVPK